MSRQNKTINYINKNYTVTPASIYSYTCVTPLIPNRPYILQRCDERVSAMRN